MKSNLLCLFSQAQVLWPVDMPDDMLEDAIQISKKAMDEHDFEEHGVDVSSFFNVNYSLVTCPPYLGGLA